LEDLERNLIRKLKERQDKILILLEKYLEIEGLRIKYKLNTTWKEDEYLKEFA